MKKITAEKWFKAPKEYKQIKNGQKWLFYRNEKGATTFGPVKIEKSLKDRVRENNQEEIEEWEDRAEKGEIMQIM